MICSASIAHLAGNTMPTPPIAPWGQYGSVLRLLPPRGNTAPCYAYCPVGAIRLRARHWRAWWARSAMRMITFCYGVAIPWH